MKHRKASIVPADEVCLLDVLHLFLPPPLRFVYDLVEPDVQAQMKREDQPNWPEIQMSDVNFKNRPTGVSLSVAVISKPQGHDCCSSRYHSENDITRLNSIFRSGISQPSLSTISFLTVWENRPTLKSNFQQCPVS